jgi:type VI secretion system secreted protein Hcp
MAGQICAFLELEGVKGEAQDSKFKEQIELQSFSWGVSNSSSYESGTGGNIGAGTIHEISFSKFMCKASTELMRRCANGKAIAKGKLSLYKLAGESDDDKLVYYECEFEKIVFRGYQVAASGGAQLPMESASMAFVTMKPQYTPQDNDGSALPNIHFKWDLQQNKEVS